MPRAATDALWVSSKDQQALMRANPEEEFRGIVIAIVEDDFAVRNSLSFSLQAEGFLVRAYACAEDVLEDAFICEAGCLVVDFKLPKMNGLELLAELRRRGVDAPAILIATHPEAKLRNGAAVMQAAIIEKPLIGEELFQEIRSALVGVKPYDGPV